MNRMTLQHKLMAYVLNKEFEYMQTEIAKLMGVSQTTISKSVNEISKRLKTENLNSQLNIIRTALEKQGLKPELPILNLDALKK